MSRPLLALARQVIDRGVKSAADLEVYALSARTVTIKAFAGVVESISAAEPCGLGVRAIRQQRQGYAYTSDLSSSGLDTVVAEAVANAALAEPDPFVALPEPPSFYPELPGLWRPGVTALPVAEKSKMVLDAEAAALGEPEVDTVEETIYQDTETRVAVASTHGIMVESAQTSCYLYLLAHARRGDETESGHGFSAGRDPLELEPRVVGREAARKAVSLLGAAPCRSGMMSVVLDHEIAAALMMSVAQALSAEAVQKGRSLFATRLGTTVGSLVLHLTDDGLRPDGLESFPFDGEGVAHGSTTLIEAGLLRGILHNSYTARKQGPGTASTGNATRSSYRGLPGLGITNLVLRAGSGTVDDLLRRVGDGLYVQTISGLHSGVNPVSGEISVGVTGRLIEHGALARPVREVTIATDFLSLLAGMTDMSGDPRWVPLYGSVLTPAVAVAQVAVSGS